MVDEPDNLILVYLRRLDAKVDGLAGDMREVKARLGLVEVSLAGLRREVAHLSESYALLSVRMDHFDERLSRVERRLDTVAA